jgi:hypothetical protein
MAPLYSNHSPNENLGMRLITICSVLVVLLLGVTNRGYAGSYVEIQLPNLHDNSEIAGVYVVRAFLRPSLPTSKLSFYIGGHPIGELHGRETSFPWDTRAVPDGTYVLRVVASAATETIAQRHVLISVNNQQIRLAVMSPELLSPLSRVEQIRVRGTDPKYYPAIWQAEVDGETVNIAYTDNSGLHTNEALLKVDTTRFTDGMHDLYIQMHSDYWNQGKARKSYYNFRAGFERLVQFANGHALMGIRAQYLHVYLASGESLSLGCAAEYTDSTTEGCSDPAYISSDPSVVTTHRDGTITANRDGFATITLTDMGRTASAYVWVKPKPGVPHFSGDGRLLESYEPGKSLFVVAPFALLADELERSPKLLSDVKEAGINTISQGFFWNPRNLDISFNDWKSKFEGDSLKDWHFVSANALHVWATGDEVCRRIGGDAWWSLNWPVGRKAIDYALSQLTSTHLAIALDVVDEASMIWGPTPTPPGAIGRAGGIRSIKCAKGDCTVDWPDNPFFLEDRPGGRHFVLLGSAEDKLATRPGHLYEATIVSREGFWFHADTSFSGAVTNDPTLLFLWWSGDIAGCLTFPCDPPVPNNALTTITRWLRDVRPRISISWPALSLSPPAVQGAWMGSGSISDYASHYWTSFNERPSFPWTSGIQEETFWLRQAFYLRQPYMQLSRPQMMEVSVTGEMYVKRNRDTAYYSPIGDELQLPGVDGSAIIAQMFTAAALGAAGERLYTFEDPNGVLARTQAAEGSTLQTGVNPTARDAETIRRWRAISYAARMLTGILQPYILADEENSPAMGRNIVTAVRRNEQNRMLLIINDNDWDRRVPVDYRRYRDTGHQIRYLISQDGVVGPTTVPGTGEALDLGPGCVAIYIFSH